ncbi:hypothetical protein J6A31_04535 [bacterium]|nr:hypothetical protein [bacterium]
MLLEKLVSRDVSAVLKHLGIFKISDLRGHTDVELLLSFDTFGLTIEHFVELKSALRRKYNVSHSAILQQNMTSPLFDICQDIFKLDDSLKDMRVQCLDLPYDLVRYLSQLGVNILCDFDNTLDFALMYDDSIKDSYHILKRRLSHVYDELIHPLSRLFIHIKNKSCSKDFISTEGSDCGSFVDSIYGAPNGMIAFKGFSLDGRNLISELCINQTSLSVSVKNLLLRTDVVTLNEVLSLKDNVISSIPGFGEKRFNELVSYLKQICVFNTFDKAEVAISNISINKDSILQLSELFYEDIKTFDMTSISLSDINSMLNVYDVSLVHKALFADNVDALFRDEDVTRVVYSHPVVVESLKQYLLCKLRMESFFVDADTLTRDLPESAIRSGKIDDILLELASLRIITKCDDKYVFNHPSIVDVLQNLNDDIAANITLEYIDGKSIVDITKESGTTRMNITNKIERFFKHRCPIAYEDRYLYWYGRYAFTKHEFMAFFGVDEYVYRYVDLREKKGVWDIESIVDDKHATSEIVEFANNLFSDKKDRICINGILTNVNPIDITLSLLRAKPVSVSSTWSEIHEEYQSLCEFHELYDIIDRQHSFANWSDAIFIRHTLLSENKHIRYYDMDSYNLKSFFECINFGRYKGHTQAYQIFNDHKHLMQQFDVRSGYELHDLMKKNTRFLPSGVYFGANPCIKIHLG